MTTLGWGLQPATCPRCGGALSERPGTGVLSCAACGHAVPAAAVQEMEQLTAWAGWAQARAAWLRERLAAGDLPADGWSVGALGAAGPFAAPATSSTPAPPRPQPGRPAAPAPSAGTWLLVGGAALLVLAGIAFVAFAWDLLGPLGQLVTLYALGVLAVAAGLRLRPRLPGTSTTLGVVGVLLVAVSTVATRVLAGDSVGATGALAASVVAAAALTWAGLALRPRLPAVGELAALVGAGLVVVLIGLAPADDALTLGARWAWWPAAALLLGGLVLVVLGHVWRVRAWPPLAAVLLVIGSFVLTGWVGDVVGSGGPGEDWSAVVASLVLLAVAAAEWLFGRRLPWHPTAPQWASAVAWGVAVLMALLAGASIPAPRPLAAVVLLGAAGGLYAVRTRLTLPGPLVASAAAALLGAAVGLAVAPWARGTWEPWQGPLAGLALGGLLVAFAESGRGERAAGVRRDLAALVAGLGGTGVWVLAVLATYADRPTVPDDARLGIAIALLLVALAGWAEAVRRRLLAWSVWLPAVLVGAAVLLLLGLTGVESDWGPEVVGLCLGAVAAGAGALTWWLRRPEHTSSLVVIGPALTLLLAPTTWAMAGAALDRWFGLAGEASEDPAYQVRVVALFVVGAALVAYGAWRRLSGVVLPAAAALLVVTVVQLVDLGRFLPQWVSFAVAGGLLVLAGARWEAVRSVGRDGNRWVRALR